ncbi:MAG: HD domain-containing phosphohydrolase [bacterium]|jgi:GAF domain-containing protein|nr:HD domain-containing phosphohydrolase [bacterium]
MSDTKYLSHIRFIDIASNPYLLSLHKGLSSFMPQAQWWIVDEMHHCFPFPESSALGPNPVNSAAVRVSTPPQFQAGQNGTATIHPCPDGTLQGSVPFRYRNHVLGGIVICAVPADQQTFLDQALRIIDGYLTLLSGALEDHDDLELMHDIWAETITMTDLSVLLERVMDEICTVLNLDRGILFLLNEDGEFYPAHVRNYPHELCKLHNLEISRFDYMEPMGLPPVLLRILPEDDPLRQWTIRVLQEHQAPPEDQICLAIPFYRNTTLIGIFLTWVDSFHPVSENRQSLIRMLTIGGAAAIDNALTLERMSQRRKALSTIHVVHRLMSSRITTKELLPKIGQLTKQLLKVKKCAILICDKAKTKLIPKVTLGLEKNEIGHRTLQFGEGLPGWVAENFNPVIYHPSEKTPPPWVDSGDIYPSEAYMAVALFDTDIEGVIMVADKEDNFTPGEREILLTFAEQVIIAIKNARLHEGERTITINALKTIANIIETHDPDTPGTTVMTCEWALRIASVLRLSDLEYQRLTFAALLHDTGMIRSMQSHVSIEEQQRKGPLLSRRFVESMGLSNEIALMVYHVNEAWDGQGFPDGLKGNKIPLGSRIITVAHTFAQLYNRHHSHEMALRVIHRMKNRAFDPDIVHALEQAITNPPEENHEG